MSKPRDGKPSHATRERGATFDAALGTQHS